MSENREVGEIVGGDRKPLVVNQPDGGYRYTIDPILLAFFLRPKVGNRIIDFGSGVGIIGIVLASISPGVTVSGVEIQEDLHNAAVKNIGRNSLEERVESRLGDFRSVGNYFEPSSFSAAVSNPPYYSEGEGRIGRRTGAAVARHGTAGDVKDVIKGASLVLKKGGTLSLIFPARKYQYLKARLGEGGFSTKRIRFVHSKERGEPKTVMVEAVLGESTPLETMPPLIVHRDNGEYSDEVGAMFQKIGAM